MAHAVVLLVGSCQFVFLDAAFEIFPAARDGDQAHLAVLAHDLAVKIETGLRIRSERLAGDQFLKILLPFRVNLRRINLHAGRQVNFRFAYVQDTERVARGYGAGFGGRHYVVRQFADSPGQVGPRSQRGKGSHGRHKKVGEDREASRGWHDKSAWSGGIWKAGWAWHCRRRTANRPGSSAWPGTKGPTCCSPPHRADMLRT